jgi:hypothetical protein
MCENESPQVGSIGTSGLPFDMSFITDISTVQMISFGTLGFTLFPAPSNCETGSQLAAFLSCHLQAFMLAYIVLGFGRSFDPQRSKKGRGVLFGVLLWATTPHSLIAAHCNRTSRCETHCKEPEQELTASRDIMITRYH